MSAIEDHLRRQLPEIIATLKDFCRIPSVSTDPAYAGGVAEAAAFVARALRQAGFPAVETIATGGHPAVLAEWCAVPGAPTILVYGHYDVQPPDPVDKWTTPPFEPSERGGRLFARGVSDDKGPLLIPIRVAQAFGEVTGGPPVNMKVLIEGEEETGSPNFAALVSRLRARLACDCVVSADGAMWRADLPSVMVAGRGLLAFEVRVDGAAKDLHSGRHGGMAPNPLRALARMLATLHDADGRASVPGFADPALPPDPAIAAAIRSAAFAPGQYFDQIGADRPEPLPAGDDLLAANWLRPTIELNGLWGGYSGPGNKTVIPAEAHAKITCRLVAGQSPDQAFAALSAHLAAVCPSGYRLTLRRHGPGTEAFALDTDDPYLAVTEEVLGEVLGARPLRVAMGATIPIPGIFRRELGVGTVFFSFSTADEDYHAPDENFRLASLENGLVAWSRLLGRLSALAPG